MSAWGKAGRVTLRAELRVSVVAVDGLCVGSVGESRRCGWLAYAIEGAPFAGPSVSNLPSRDAAVLWVLRRVDPALWRQERGDVFRVQVGLAEFPMLRWHVHAPAGTRHGWNYGCEPEHWDSTSTWAEAIDCAHQRIMAVSR